MQDNFKGKERRQQAELGKIKFMKRMKEKNFEDNRQKKKQESRNKQ